MKVFFKEKTPLCKSWKVTDGRRYTQEKRTINSCWTAPTLFPIIFVRCRLRYFLLSLLSRLSFCLHFCYSHKTIFHKLVPKIGTKVTLCFFGLFLGLLPPLEFIMKATIFLHYFLDHERLRERGLFHFRKQQLEASKEQSWSLLQFCDEMH